MAFSYPKMNLEQVILKFPTEQEHRGDDQLLQTVVSANTAAFGSNSILRKFNPDKEADKLLTQLESSLKRCKQIKDRNDRTLISFIETIHLFKDLIKECNGVGETLKEYYGYNSRISSENHDQRILDGIQLKPDHKPKLEKMEKAVEKIAEKAERYAKPLAALGQEEETLIVAPAQALLSNITRVLKEIRQLLGKEAVTK